MSLIYWELCWSGKFLNILLKLAFKEITHKIFGSVLKGNFLGFECPNDIQNSNCKILGNPIFFKGDLNKPRLQPQTCIYLLK